MQPHAAETTKHPDCDPCDCGASYDAEHCRHAHQPWFELDDQARAILDFERDWWKHAGAKEAAIRETFNVSAVRYFQMLNTIISTDAALEHDPLLVRRLRRLRDARARQRSAQRLQLDA